MKKAPLISVIMPVYNGEKYLVEAIESILTQTLTNFEFIIINDASTDKTAKILKKYVEKDPRIRVLTNKTNLNIAETRNRGIREAKTDIIVSMDADDVAFPDRFKQQYEVIKANPKVAVVGGDIQIIDEGGNAVTYRSYKTTSKLLKRTMLRYSPFAQSATMLRKSYAEEFGLYNPKMSPSEDVDLWFRLGTKYDFASIPYPLLKYRVYMGSNSNKKLRKVEILTLLLRINAVRNLGYKFGISDIIYNVLLFISSTIFPSDFRVRLFNFLRNKGFI